MADESSTTSNGAVTTALVRAAGAAGHAPSVHNTQPWHWRVLPDRLELYAVRDRQLTGIDPDARLLLISCGTALDHARLALAAEGWTARTDRLPDPARPDLLAVLTPTGHSPAPEGAMRMVQSMEIRHTDRRPVSDEPLPAGTLDAVRAAAAEYVSLQVLSPEQVLELAAAASQATAAEADDPQIAEELRYWTSLAAPAGTGLPAEVLPREPARSTVPGRDFGGPGSLPIGPGHDRAAAYAVLFGDEDEPDRWLRAGEGLSAAWLTATALGASVVPLSWVVEVGGTRQTLRRALAGLHPYLVLRLGVADPAHAGPPHTPRLPVEQVVDTSAVRAG